jgi:hypothetical protein
MLAEINTMLTEIKCGVYRKQLIEQIVFYAKF